MKSLDERIEEMEKSPDLSDEDKKIIIARAKASGNIAESIKELKLPPHELIHIFMGMACGVTVNCDQPFNATAFMLRCMADFYEHYQNNILASRKEKKEEKKDADKD